MKRNKKRIGQNVVLVWWSGETLMFACLQKDAEQCCDVTKRDCTHCAVTLSTFELCGVTALFGVFLDTNKHPNLP